MRSALAVGLVAVGVVVVGWLQSPSDITAAEAVRVARDAFRAADIDEARVDPHPRAGTYRPVDSGEPLPVWRTSTRVPGGSVELWLAREDGEPVFLDDRSGDGAVQLLSDAEFQALAEHYENPATGRQVRRNLLLTLAAALATAVAVRWDLQRALPPAVAAPTVTVPAPSPPAAVPRAALAAPTPTVSSPAAPAPPAASTGRAPARRPSRTVPLSASPRRADRPLRAQEIL